MFGVFFSWDILSPCVFSTSDDWVYKKRIPTSLLVQRRWFRMSYLLCMCVFHDYAIFRDYASFITMRLS